MKTVAQRGGERVSLLDVLGIVKTYGEKRVVDELSFGVEKGDAFGLLGPNGAGKSTVIKIVSSLLSPDRGTVLYEGVDLNRQRRQVRRKIGLVPQNVTLFTAATAEENLHFFGTLYGLAGVGLKRRIASVLQSVGLEQEGRTVVRRYSGGMQRRLNIAVALLHEPPLLIMDEPTVGIDPQSRTHILDLVKRLCANGTTVIYTSHYMEEVEYLCNRLAIIDHGKMIAYGRMEDVRKLAGSLTAIDIDVPEITDEALVPLRREPAIKQVVLEGHRVRVLAAEPAFATAEAVTALARQGLEPRAIVVAVPNLETVFLHLTGRSLRDASEEGKR